MLKWSTSLMSGCSHCSVIFCATGLKSCRLFGGGGTWSVAPNVMTPYPAGEKMFEFKQGHHPLKLLGSSRAKMKIPLWFWLLKLICQVESDPNGMTNSYTIW